MFRAIAALILASTSAQTSPTLTSTAPWWERVTVTVNDDGNTQSCVYKSSLQPTAAKECSVSGNEAELTDWFAHEMAAAGLPAARRARDWAVFKPERSGKPVVLLAGHSDTVPAQGNLRAHPPRHSSQHRQ